MNAQLRRLLATVAVLLLIPILAYAQSTTSTNGVIVWEATQQAINDIQTEITTIQNTLASPKPVGISFDFIGVPPGNTELRFVAPTTINIPANFGAGSSPAWASLCNAGTAATSFSSYNIKHNDVLVATLSFNASSNTCIFSTQSSFNLNTGDTLSIIAQSNPDPTLAGIAITIGGSR